MKLFATLAAVASASWNGVSEDNSCGIKSLVTQWSTQPVPSLVPISHTNSLVMVLSSLVPTLSLVLMVSLVTSMWLFSSNKTAHPVNAITQPAGMPQSAVLTMVQPQPVFSSWKPSMTTEVPKVVMSTSKLLESAKVIPSQSI